MQIAKCDLAPLFLCYCYYLFCLFFIFYFCFMIRPIIVICASYPHNLKYEAFILAPKFRERGWDVAWDILSEYQIFLSVCLIVFYYLVLTRYLLQIFYLFIFCKGTRENGQIAKTELTINGFVAQCHTLHDTSKIYHTFLWKKKKKKNRRRRKKKKEEKKEQANTLKRENSPRLERTELRKTCTYTKTSWIRCKNHQTSLPLWPDSFPMRTLL